MILRNKIKKMETENIERMIDKSEDESNKEEKDDEKSVNEEEEEESEKIKEDNQEQNEENNQIDNHNQEKNNQKENEIIKQSENQKQEIIDIYSTTTYILKYKRSKEELKELAIETNLPKSENCYFMINLKIIKTNDLTDNNNKNLKNEENPNFLVICCHEIAAIYFDEIYERIYTLEDLFTENIFFKVFDTIEEARNIIDESIKKRKKK